MTPGGSAKNKRGAKAGAAVAAAGNGNAAANAAADASTSTSAAASDFAGLVPSSADEFRSLRFWDGFFRARGDAAFEWYGDWRTLKPILLPLCCLANGGDGGGAKKPTPSPPPLQPKILMLGCGNSELSAQMYDAGCEAITNVDFCPAVIREMLGKNLRRRPRMQWLVADITGLPPGRFPDRGFDVVVDKGGLDALHSDDGGEEEEEDGSGNSVVVDFSRGGVAAAVGLAASVRRVLAPGGRYACVSLCQRAVLSGLLASYRLGRGWEVSIEAPPPPPDMAGSPLQPLCVVVRRPGRADEDEEEEEAKGGKGSSFSPVVCRVPRPRLDAPNAEQLADVFAAVAAENAARERGERSAWVEAADRRLAAASTSGGSGSSLAEPPATPAKPSSSSSSSRPPSSATPSCAAPPPPPPPVSFDELCPGREVEVLLPQQEKGDGSQQQQQQQQRQRHRYVATVVDRELPPRTNNRAPSRAFPPPPAPTCSVFIVPQGREHEWLFSTREGRATVAAQVGAGRCVFVAAAAGAPFPAAWDAAALQRDLDPLVLPLTPLALRGIAKAVPFVTLGGEGGLGKAPRRVCEIAESSEVPGTGSLLVEDVEVSPDESDDDEEGGEKESDDVVVVGARRLVFGGARSLIQSEVPLVVPRKFWGRSRSQAKKEKGEKGAKEPEQKQEPFPALSTHLPSAYHCAILAGLAALGGGGAGGGASGERSVLLVGLGAGGLAAHLAAERRCAVAAVELDPRVVELARGHFGLASVEEKLLGAEERGSLAVVVGDGVVEVEKAAAAAAEAASSDSPRSSSSSHLSAIIVDAGGGDASLAMSCPPPPFVTDAFAASAAAALRERGGGGHGGGGQGGGGGGQGGGVLAVNCVSRDERPVAALADTLKRHFSRVFEIDVPEDVNRVLFATGPKEKGGAEAAAAAAPSGSSAASKQGGRPKKKLPPLSLPRGDEAVSKALDAYFGACSGASVRDPGDAAGGSSVAEIAALLVER